jgi:hypothetical protein
MKRDLTSPPSPATRCTVAVAVAVVLGLGLPQSLMAQDPAPEEAAAPAETPAADAAPAEATDTETVSETIPVQDAPDAAVDSAVPAYPYNYAALRFMRIDYDESEADGFGLEGSYLLMPNVFAIAAYAGASSDDAASTESSQFQVGAGIRAPATQSLDFNATIRMVTTDSESATDTGLDLGYRFDAGVRGRLASRLEGNAALSYVEGQQHHHGFFVGSALYELMPQLSLGAEVIAGNSSTSYGVLGRWAF